MAGKTDGGLDVGGIFSEAINGFLKSAGEASTPTGAAAYTGLIEDVKRAHNSGDSNAVVKLGLTLLGVYAAGVVAENVLQNKETKGLNDGKSSSK